MKPPGDPVPSGDRTMARLLMAALSLAGHDVEQVSNFRSWDATSNQARQQRLARIGERLAGRELRRRQARPELRPALWFTYHLYHKAPDFLGPRVSQALGIPYIVAEASSAGKQAAGQWALGWAAAAAAIRQADLILGLNPADDDGIRALLADPSRLRRLPPFLDVRAFAGATTERAEQRRLLAERFGFDPAEPLLLTVAMMRPGDKATSFILLARALALLADRPWRLLIAGDGPATREVEAAFAPLAGRTMRLGCLDEDALRRLYAACDLYVWPAINEAWGMTLLEAEAAGLPVVAGNSGGVAAVVADGVSGLLVAPGEVDAFAAAVRILLADPVRRATMGEAARHLVSCRHDLPTAARSLDAAIRSLPTVRRCA